MGFQDVAFQLSKASLPPHFLKMAVEVKAVGLPHVLKQSLEVSRCIFPVKYLPSNKASFCVSENVWRS